jgi:hypothetical protein
MANVVVGLAAKLYWNSGNFSVPVWNEVTNARDVTINMDKDEFDASTRGSGGWEATVMTLKKASVDFDILYLTGDANFTAFLGSYLNNTTLDMLAYDGPYNQAGCQGLRAPMQVSKCSRKEPLKEGLTSEISVKPTYNSSFPAPIWQTT